MVGSNCVAVAGGGGETGQHLSVERDGLLGSGNRPPPTGTRINKHIDSYQPPRPAVKVFLYFCLRCFEHLCHLFSSVCLEACIMLI